MDVRPACGVRQAAIIYLQGGYWQSRDKSMFRFIAPLDNYPLCREAPTATCASSA